jgi:hypothetical protein
MQSGRALHAVSVEDVQVLQSVLLRALRFMSQAWLLGSQTYCVLPLEQAEALSLVHCTHAPARQTFLPEMWEQSASTAQAMQALAVQRDAVGALQSPLTLQSTHWLPLALHTSLVPEHAAWSLALHCTQFPAAQTLRPVKRAHWALASQATQLCVAWSHLAFALPVQSVSLAHSTHWPVSGMQTRPASHAHCGPASTQASAFAPASPVPASN